MTDLRQREGRPADNGAAISQSVQAGGPNESSLPDPVGGVTDDTAAGAFFRNCYAVLVQGRTVRRHLYFNLPAAERAVRRALGRGDCAEMILVQLVPVRGGRDG